MASPTTEPLDASATAQRLPRTRTVQCFQPSVMKHLKDIYASNADSSDKTWTPSQTLDFATKIQQQHVAVLADDRQVAPTLDLDGFLDYMASSEAAAILLPEKEDFSWPLSAYFISSSHNTYLTGNQLYSDSTTKAYANVLRRGCRCVEIDVWDGTGSDAESSASSSDEEDSPHVVAAPDTVQDAATDQEKSDGGRDKQSTLDRLRAHLPTSVLDRMSRTSRLSRKLKRTESHKLSDAKNSPTPLSASSSSSSVANEPRVLHGYTLTKEVSFRDVCKTIRKNAFAVTDLPLIISLEVHCNSEQQAIMVQIMKEAWADVAVISPPEHDMPARLPSPDALRGKILVKVKYAAPDSAAKPKEDQKKPDDKSGHLPSGSSDDDKSAATMAKKPSKIIQALSDLGIYTRAVSFKSWTQPEATMPAHIFSLSEKKFATHHVDHGKELFEHNRHYMMRAYPSGLRVGSSNLNPPPFWGSGAQIVALNWQQTDEGMMLNQGMFGGTGGYILKPEGYRPDIEAKSCQNSIIRKTLSLSVTILAAQFIPLPDGDTSDSGFWPYVKMELHVDGNPGIEDDALHGNRKRLASQQHKFANHQGRERGGEYKAHTKSHRGGADVDFGSQTLSFQDIDNIVEELTFLRFKVCDDEIGKDDLAAWACVRLDRLASGYRFLHLWDSESRYSNGVILIKVEKQLV